MATKRRAARSRTTKAGARKKAAKKKAPRRKAAARRAPKKKAAKKKTSTKKRAPRKKAAAKRAPKRKAAKKEVSKKKAPAKKAAGKKAPRKAVRRKAPAKVAGARKPAGKAASAGRPDAARRAAAVREQLSKAKIGTFEDLVGPCEPEIRTIAEQLRSLVFELIPDARETVYLRWRIALYKKATEICGIQPAADRCNFYLTKGAYLHDPQGILEGTGKSIRHVKVRSVVGMAAESLRDLLKQALEITRP